MSELDPKLTFETFVVGPANRLAAAAARRAADSPGTAYNPLFVYSASGLGKSHIMNALALHARKVHPAANVLYQTTEGYLDELAEALSTGDREAMRERYQNLDILLLDDVQFLTGQTEAQEMLLRALDALAGEGKQVVLASDRGPGEINALDARLVSRFSGGLLVDIGQPEYETRVAIVRRKSNARGASLEAGVAEEVARFPFRNVRELQGGLNRILAIQELEGRAVSREEAKSLLGPPDAYAGEEAVRPATPAEAAATEPSWSDRIEQAVREAKAQGFNPGRLQRLLDRDTEPTDLDGVLSTFREELARLQMIREELDEVGNPWPEAAASVLKDPDRIEEAETLLNSARERNRPFAELGEGPALADVEDLFAPLAVRAAEQLVNDGSPDYNPVVLVCPDQDYVAQLLQAAGRTYAEANPEKKVGFVSAAEFAEEFIHALSGGVAGAWRERWWSVDLLLIHGAQSLAAMERAQDEFFQLFEALKRNSSRIFVAADRVPGTMEGLDDRVRSRFEAGLVVEVDAEPLATAPVQEEQEEPEETLIPPLRDLEVSDDGTGGLFFDRKEGDDRAPAEEEEAWFPSPEKVVWEWPDLDDLLYEEAD
jgi:chromosomal replication initiation ATPase DnaA